MKFNCSLCGISVAEFFCTKWEYVIVKNKEEGKMKKKNVKNTQTDRRRRKEFASLILDG